MEEENGTAEPPLTNPVTDTPSPSVAGCLEGSTGCHAKSKKKVKVPSSLHVMVTKCTQAADMTFCNSQAQKFEWQCSD